jgi:ABC-2 type transport system ATP-binding protein
VLLTTQYLDEADRLARRVVIIDQGRVIADGSPASLKSQAGRNVIEVHTREIVDTSAAAQALNQLGLDEPRIDAATRRVSISVDDGADRLMLAVRALDDAGVAVEDIALRRPTLDEVFLSLTGQAIEDLEPKPRRRGRAA